jgi:hypothetical protein
VSKEFEAQAATEEKLGLPVAPFMKNLNDPKVRGKCQLGFIDFVLTPLWSELKTVFPQLAFAHENLMINRRFFACMAGNERTDHITRPSRSFCPTTAHFFWSHVFFLCGCRGQTFRSEGSGGFGSERSHPCDDAAHRRHHRRFRLCSRGPDPYGQHHRCARHCHNNATARLHRSYFSCCAASRVQQ